MDNLKYFFLDLRDDILDFIDDHRTGLIIFSIIAIFLLIALMVVFVVFAPAKIVISNVNTDIGNVIGDRKSVV